MTALETASPADGALPPTGAVQFLDTSHQIDRVAGHFAVRRQRSIEVYRDGRACTSSIVRMEYKRSALADLAVLGELIEDMAHDKRREPRAFLGDLRDMVRVQKDRPSITYSERRLKRISQWVDRLEENLAGYATPFVVNVMRIAWRCLMERAEEDFYIVVYGPGDEKDIRDEPGWWIDGTACALTAERARPLDILDDRTPECENDRADCKLANFFHSNAPRLQALLQEVRARESKPSAVKEGLWKGLKKLDAVIGSLPDEPVGKRFCWTINDLQIALETPSGACLLATDRDFDYLFEFLGHAVRCPRIVPASQIASS